jgi:hypothetical protein
MKKGPQSLLLIPNASTTLPCPLPRPIATHLISVCLETLLQGISCEPFIRPLHCGLGQVVPAHTEATGIGQEGGDMVLLEEVPGKGQRREGEEHTHAELGINKVFRGGEGGCVVSCIVVWAAVVVGAGGGDAAREWRLEGEGRYKAHLNKSYNMSCC